MWVAQIYDIVFVVFLEITIVNNKKKKNFKNSYLSKVSRVFNLKFNVQKSHNIWITFCRAFLLSLLHLFIKKPHTHIFKLTSISFPPINFRICIKVIIIFFFCSEYVLNLLIIWATACFSKLKFYNSFKRKFNFSEFSYLGIHFWIINIYNYIFVNVYKR